MVVVVLGIRVRYVEMLAFLCMYVYQRNEYIHHVPKVTPLLNEEIRTECSLNIVFFLKIL